MRKENNLLAGSVVTLTVGVIFWVLVAWRTPGGEPWDAPAYWTVVYPIALAIAAALGACFPRRAWLWGLLFMVVPVVVVASGFGPLLLAGLVYTLVLSLPAMAIAAAAGALRRRLHRRD